VRETVRKRRMLWIFVGVANLTWHALEKPTKFLSASSLDYRLVVDPRDARIFFHMLKAIVHLNNSSSFLNIYQMLFVSLIYLLNL
jgi:hypothetical protein